MKRILLSLVAIATLSLSSLAQAPEGFNYQAVVRNAGGIILNNQPVGMRLTVQQGSIGGTAVYTETFTSTTNGYGLVNLEVGTGTSTDDFSTIDWASGPYFMETAVDVTGGTTYSVMGTSQLMSVPYALYAKTSGNGEGPVGPTGATGPQGPAGADGQGGATTAGTNVTITGTGTVGDPYVVNATGGGSPIYTIGLWPELGGYVFWVSADGKHGLVAETQDQGVSNWYEAQNLISNPSNHSLNGQKFRDWRMPTKHELNEIYLQQAVVGGFANATYWSSTEYGFSDAWDQGFPNGLQLYGGLNYKATSNFVRSVRAF